MEFEESTLNNNKKKKKYKKQVSGSLQFEKRDLTLLSKPPAVPARFIY